MKKNESVFSEAPVYVASCAPRRIAHRRGDAPSCVYAKEAGPFSDMPVSAPGGRRHSLSGRGHQRFAQRSMQRLIDASRGLLKFCFHLLQFFQFDFTVDLISDFIETALRASQ